MSVLLLLIFLLINRCLAQYQHCMQPDFMWGVATSSYQVEGGWNASGKGENVWDWFTHTYPTKIADGTNGDIAADSFHKYEEDIALLADLGVDSYRFSLSWARILPDGTTDNINRAGVDYYLDLIKKLRERNIEPLVTIYHWDLPLPFQKIGGWLNPKVADYYAEYATLCFALFGDYVKYWITLNEPFKECSGGYGSGKFPPELKKSGTMVYKCYYTHMLANAKAYRSYNKMFRATQRGKVGITQIVQHSIPLNNSQRYDIQSAENNYLWDVGMLMDPITYGNWPRETIVRIDNLSARQGLSESRLPKFSDDQKELLQGTYDFVGLNYYSTYITTSIPNIIYAETRNISYNIDKNVDDTYINKSWPQGKSAWLRSYPPGIRGALNWIANRYGNPPIIITENGWSDTPNDSLEDTNRVNYIRDHVCYVLKAKYIDGVKVFGYTYWSFMNNFEFRSGFQDAFGLLHVDFSSPNRTRTPKASFYYYQQLLRTNCIDCPFKLIS